jgi:tRNA 2-thiocytidine biosynthesis protein TtcA
VIRPLCYSAEEDIAEYARLREFPILPCDLCGSQDNLKRQRVKRLIEELNTENPNVRGNLFAALGNVRSSHLMPGPVPVALHQDRRLKVVPS